MCIQSICLIAAILHFTVPPFETATLAKFRLLHFYTWHGHCLKMIDDDTRWLRTPQKIPFNICSMTSCYKYSFGHKKYRSKSQAHGV